MSCIEQTNELNRTRLYQSTNDRDDNPGPSYVTPEIRPGMHRDWRIWVLSSQWTKRQIQYSIRKLVGSSIFLPCDAPDLYQELALDLWLRLEMFDPRRSSLQGYVVLVLVHRQSDLIKKSLSDKRRANLPALQVSLDTPVGEDDDGEGELTLGDTLERPVPLTCWRRTELKLDVRSALSQLDPAERELALLLTHRSVTATAKYLGVSRRTVYNRINNLRVKLEPLRGYVGRE